VKPLTELEPVPQLGIQTQLTTVMMRIRNFFMGYL
jgi:hypothetical protein